MLQCLSFAPVLIDLNAMKSFFAMLIALLLGLGATAQAQPIDPTTVTISRDAWGVPHIHAPTDAGTAYGLAWANAEDNFHDMQLNLLMARARQGEVLGKNGAVVDYAVQMLGVRELVRDHYAADVSPKFKQHLEAYAQGINAFAQSHPHEILAKRLFPIDTKDVLAGYVMSLVLMEGAHFHFLNILDGRAGAPTPYSLRGSNGFAFNSSRTADGQVYLVNNSHQPLDGPTAWYEAHLMSDEGLNVLGGLFPGGVSIFAGCNTELGWMHTVNQPDLVDVYHLVMHPKEKYQYKYDGEWKTLTRAKAKMKVKVGPFKLAVHKKIYWSVHGPALRYKKDFYALRFPAIMTIKAAEQWFAMNKAQNFTEFYTAIQMGGLPSLNIVYGDRRDTIFYIDNGLYPMRAPGYDWLGLLPGDTSAVVWDSFHPTQDLVQCLNPASGYVFNTNNTPFNCTAPADNPQQADYDSLLLTYPIENNRSLRVQEIMAGMGKMSYDDMLRLKYDAQYPDSFYIHFMSNVNCIDSLSPLDYPEVAEELQLIQDWDRRTNVENTHAALFVKTYDYLYAEARGKHLTTEATCYPARYYIDAIKKASAYLRKHFGSIEIPLGLLQRHVRGDQDFPIGGAPDVISAMYCHTWKDGRKRSYLGDSYIQFMRFSEQGVKIQSVQPYGNSNHPDSPHFADQMDLYLHQKTKEESLTPAWVKGHAVEVYHPGERAR
jgi:acyl-homoserine-lactone acylase